jgi:ABC-type multidrug transport system fused ATPase/permease subunit
VTPPDPVTRPRRTRSERLADIEAGLGPFARPHRRQLAFPWPLKWLVGLSRPGPTGTSGWAAYLPSGANPVVWLAGAFTLLGMALGVAEYWQRVAISRFVVPALNDARLGVFTRFLEGSGRGGKSRDPGDVVTRMVTDTARLRVGLKGLLVHVLQHGLFVLGVCVVLLFVDLRLGFCYLVGLALALAVALRGTDMTATASRKSRGLQSRRVGHLLHVARSVHELPVKDPDRARPDALLTQMKGRVAWVVQGVLAVTACLVLLMLHYPMTRIGRQITRLGPQLTSAERLTRLVQASGPGVEHP